MHGGNMMGPSEKVAAKENERQMSEIFLTSSELTNYVRSVIQLIEIVSFLVVVDLLLMLLYREFLDATVHLRPGVLRFSWFNSVLPKKSILLQAKIGHDHIISHSQFILEKNPAILLTALTDIGTNCENTSMCGL